MGSQRHKGIFVWLKGLFSPKVAPLSEIARAKLLISAVDRGGIPLNAAKVNAIARDLGLEVSRKAPVEETIQRIRNALGRINHHE
jgi:hypothetical protein